MKIFAEFLLATLMSLSLPLSLSLSLSLTEDKLLHSLLCNFTPSWRKKMKWVKTFFPGPPDHRHPADQASFRLFEACQLSAMRAPAHSRVRALVPGAPLGPLWTEKTWIFGTWTTLERKLLWSLFWGLSLSVSSLLCCQCFLFFLRLRSKIKIHHRSFVLPGKKIFPLPNFVPNN